MFYREQPEMAEAHETADGFATAGAESATMAPVRRRQWGPLDPDNPSSWGKVPRNAQCPCGSGRKFKHCHGKI